MSAPLMLALRIVPGPAMPASVLSRIGSTSGTRDPKRMQVESLLSLFFRDDGMDSFLQLLLGRF